MNGFQKDILLIDFEGSGWGDIALSEPTQLGAVLLDKQSLEEKGDYLSYIAIDHPENFRQEAIELSGITPNILVDAPAKQQIANEFVKKFGTDVFLASWNSSFDQAMLQMLLHSIKKDLSYFDYHYLDIWPIAYAYLCRHGHGDIIRSEPTFKYFGQTERSNHDALDDCRRTAEVLRKVYFAKD
jgi:DNA polymerase III epsilon subunit-like protein